jgi:hypothetical protein
MKTTKPIVILLALVLLTAAGARSDEKPAKKEISNTRTASCLVKVTTDPSVLPGGIIAIEYLMHSSGVAGKAAREVLDIPPDIASELFTVEEIESIFPDSAGVGIPPDSTPGASFPGASKLGATPNSRLIGRLTPTAARTPSRSPTPTTSAARPTTPMPAAVRPPTRRTPARPRPRRTPTVTQPLPSTTEQTILFSLRVDFPHSLNVLMSNMFGDKPVDKKTVTEGPIKPAAEEFMAALIENLRSALSGASEQYSAKLIKQLRLADGEAQRAEEDLVRMHAGLREISGSRDLSRLSILSDIRNVRQKLQSAIMKRASDEMLYEATTKRIAEEEKRRKKLVEDDPITREFELILDVHERRLKDTQKLYESGRASAADLENVREKIIRARIELAKRQEEVSNPPGGIVISSLNNELANLSTEMALAQQEIRSFEEQLKEAEDLLQKTDDYELLSLKADIARQSL